MISCIDCAGFTENPHLFIWGSAAVLLFVFYKLVRWAE